MATPLIFTEAQYQAAKDATDGPLADACAEYRLLTRDHPDNAASNRRDPDGRTQFDRWDAEDPGWVAALEAESGLKSATYAERTGKKELDAYDRWQRDRGEANVNSHDRHAGPAVSAPVDDTPASMSDLTEVVARARRAHPLHVPEGFATKLATSGASLASAKSQLFHMICGDSIPVASMRRELERAGLAGEGPSSSGAGLAVASMERELASAGLKPKGAVHDPRPGAPSTALADNMRRLLARDGHGG